MTEAPEPQEGPLGRVALRLTAWSERWIPDAFVFALMATVIIVLFALGVARASVVELALAWGKGFWSLATFTLHMAMIIVIGHVLATAKPIGRLIEWLAAKPRTPREATTLVALFAMTTSWLNWGFSLIVSAMLAREVARRRPETDYRALAASSFLGLGSVWAQGLSGSAALQMASPAMLQNPAVREAVAHGGVVPGGVIPLTHTIFLWQSVASVLVEIAVVAAVVWMFTPSPARAKSAAALGVDLTPARHAEPPAPPRGSAPGARLEHSRILNLLVVALGAAYLTAYLGTAQDKLAAIDIGPINLAFLLVGLLLHGTPARVMRAARDGTPAVWGVLLQFPFYGGISGMIAGTHLNSQLAGALLRLSTPRTFPPLVAAYSALLGVFVPSGGSKWVIEAPYVMEAAHGHHVHVGWTVAVYDLGEALANLVQPFWMLPTLAILGLRARDVMGFTFVVFVILAPVVLVLVTALGATLPYPL
jgi:short-chain fatty acids transporter